MVYEVSGVLCKWCGVNGMHGYLYVGSVLCDVAVYVRSMYMSGRRVCEINVYVNFLVTRANGCGVEG